MSGSEGVNKMGKKGIGIMMMFMGIGGFVLPLMGVQFRILSFFGAGQYVVAGILAVVGLILLVAGKKKASYF